MIRIDGFIETFAVLPLDFDRLIIDSYKQTWIMTRNDLIYTGDKENVMR